MEIKLTLALPRDQLSVPVVRRVLKSALDALGIVPEVVHDIELALTEACTNVLDHSVAADEYEVSAGIDGSLCVIEVVDRGEGFDSGSKGHALAAGDAEEGRGIQLMRSLVDSLEFEVRERVGNVVRMEKQLVFPEGSPIALLTEGHAATEHGPWSQRGGMQDEHVHDDRQGAAGPR